MYVYLQVSESAGFGLARDLASQYDMDTASVTVGALGAGRLISASMHGDASPCVRSRARRESGMLQTHQAEKDICSLCRQRYRARAQTSST